MKSRQNGHAGIVFVLLLPTLWGLTAFSLDSSRGIQAKVRLGEAVDQAVIAVSARSESDSKLDRALIEEYVTSFIPDSIDVEPTLKLKDCSEDLTGNCTRYEVSARAQIDTWFPGGTTITGYDDQIAIADESMAEKLATVVLKDPVALDVVIVADTSGSMVDPFEGAASRMDAVQHVFSKVISRLEIIDNKNDDPDMSSSFGIVPFTRHYNGYGSDRPCLMYETIDIPGYRHIWDLPRTVEEMFVEKTTCASYVNSNLARRVNWEVLPTTDYTSIDLGSIQAREDGTIPVHGFIRGVQLLKRGKNKNKLFILITDAEVEDQYNQKHIDFQKKYKWCDIMRNELSSDGVNLTFVGMKIGSSENTEWFDICFGEENIYENNDLDDFFNALDEVMKVESDSDVGHYVKE
ncbi:hypothetical protein ACNO6Y_25025 [Vibrio owensii]|uniref:hypothetical protein n=1 Tax=Vibrio owensii TaxID=696485 RepID=UPI003AB10703